MCGVYLETVIKSTTGGEEEKRIIITSTSIHVPLAREFRIVAANAIVHSQCTNTLCIHVFQDVDMQTQ